MSTSNERFFKIMENGQIQNVTVHWEDIKVGDTFIDALTQNTSRKMFNIMPGAVIDPALENARFHCNCINNMGDVNWTIELPFLPITTNFKVAEDSTMTPSFSKPENPVASIMWKPLEKMRLFWVVMVQRSVNTKGKVSSANQYVVAYHADGTFHKLPISNLYDDCRLCTGNYNSEALTHVEVLQKAWSQLVKGQWQGDLYDHLPDSYRERTDRMFRFKPAEKGFSQLPPLFDKGKTWTTYADAVGTEWLAANLIIA